MAINSRIGNSSPSSLVRSAASLTKAVQNYQDQIQALQYANSAYTDSAFNSYQSYLTGRIKNLQSAGGIENMSKALTLTKTLESATHSNTSASIQRENIQVMAGNATLQDKYNVVVNQYQRAINNGDLTLAQTLEGQAYSISQTIQQQAQQAADAAASLRSASQSANVTNEGQIVSNLKEAMKSFTATAKYGSEKELNADLAKYANDPGTRKQLQALGVHIAGTQPNYWDVVSGIAGAIYNHQVLKAQAEAAINPLLSRTYASEAQDMLTGATKFQTLGGSLTAQEIMQAQQDPAMFAFDNSTNTYKRTIQSGYQYMTFTNEDGSKSTQLVPSYSGYAQRAAFNKVLFLTPTETAQMTKLGLNFTENIKGKSVANTSVPGQSGTTGAGVQAQLSSNSPQWLRNLVGENGLVNVYPEMTNGYGNGFVEFKAASSDGKGSSYYTLATDERGLSGLYEHTANGQTNFMGGDYGFDSQAASLLVSKGEQVQQQIVLAQQRAQQALKVQQAQAQAHLQAQAAAQQQALRVAQARRTAALQQTYNPQRTASPQLPTFNPQGHTLNPQGNNYNPQGSGPINPHAVAGTFRL